MIKENFIRGKDHNLKQMIRIWKYGVKNCLLYLMNLIARTRIIGF